MYTFQQTATRHIVNAVACQHCDSVLLIDVARESCTVYRFGENDLELQDTLGYHDYIISLAQSLPKAGRPDLLRKLELPYLEAQLVDTQEEYELSYQLGEGDDAHFFGLHVRWFDDAREYLLLIHCDNTEAVLSRRKLDALLQLDSERFSFLAKNVCEFFCEFEVSTGRCHMTSKKPSICTLPTAAAQIDWFAENLILDEQRAEFREEFALATFCQRLRQNQGQLISCYTIIYAEGRRELSFVATLLPSCKICSGEMILLYAQDVTRLKEQEQKNRELLGISKQLLSLSQTESLTGLLNRATAEQEITSRLSQLEVYASGSMLLIDVDYFKQFNDTYGHQVGDFVLQYVAQAMRDVFRSDDILCRWGGDEFMVFLHMARNERAVESRISRLQAKMKQCNHKGLPLVVTLSIGGAVAMPGDSVRSLFSRVDKALYSAKDAGRDGYCFA